MTSPISPHRTDPWIPHDDTTATGPATKVPVAARELPELPDTSAAAIANAVQAAKAGTARPLFAMGIEASIIQTSKRDTPIEQRLDAFKESATPTYHTPDEGDVSVPIPFRMTEPRDLPGESAFGQVEHEVSAHTAKLDAITRSVGLGGKVDAMRGGRATPEEIHRVTQALIDAGRLPPPDGKLDLAGRVRTMMCNYGLGLDCAAYTQQAFLASRDLSRSQTQLHTLVNEDLSNLAGRGFARVNGDDARAGDVVVLGPPVGGQPPGHTAIVRDTYYATADELKALVNKNPEAKSFDPARVKKIVVDSSWGNSAKALEGGVERHTWWHAWSHDQSTGKDVERWVTEDKGDVYVTDHPYLNHPLDGIYRPSTEP